MFTGLIEELGRVKEIKKKSEGWKLMIEASSVLDDLKEGDSIAVDGSCLTVTRLFLNGFEVDLSLETLKVTNFSYLKPGKMVNLERALKVGERLGGHILLGHIDAVGRVESFQKKKDFALLTVEYPEVIESYLAYKGSVGVNGVSLTISSLLDHSFSVTLIPLTLEKTNLSYLKRGELVNIETDILARYVGRLLEKSQEGKERKLKKFLTDYD